MFPKPEPYVVVKDKQQLLYPRNLHYGVTRAVTLGGIDISDVSDGIRAYVWEARCVGDKIYVCREGGKEFLYLEVGEDVKWLDFAFDTNMNTVFTYTTKSGTYLRYYSIVIGGYDTTKFVDIRTPSLLLDSNASFLDTKADLLFMYLRGNTLFYRVQNERYSNEYSLYSYDKKYMLWRTGHTSDGRVAFYIR